MATGGANHAAAQTALLSQRHVTRRRVLFHGVLPKLQASLQTGKQHTSCMTAFVVCIMAYPRTTADYAELWVDKYAGEKTAQLEEMYRKIGHRKGIELLL